MAFNRKHLDVNRLKSKKAEGRIRESTNSIIFHTKFAFLMILGIVVDDAIIVGESIYDEQQKKEMGLTLP